jgi:GAF domain-containing protein
VCGDDSGAARRSAWSAAYGDFSGSTGRFRCRLPAASARLVRDVAGEQAVESVLAQAVATLRELVRCEDVVWEATGDGELVVVLAEGDDEGQLQGMQIPFGDGLTGLAAMQGRAVVSNDAHLDARAGWVPGTARVPEAVAAMPLAARDQILGVLSLYRRGHAGGTATSRSSCSPILPQSLRSRSTTPVPAPSSKCKHKPTT